MKLLTTLEAGKLLGVDRRTIKRWIAEGHFPDAVLTAGGQARIPSESVVHLGEEMGIGKKKMGVGKALLYLRVACQDECPLLEKGLVHLSQYAQNKRYEIIRKVMEIGSGLDGDRPGLARVREEIQSGQPPYESILIESPDRLLLLGSDEFVRWAAPVVQVEVAGPSCPEADTAYKCELLLDLYYPLADALALQGVPPARIERIISEGLESIAEELGLFHTKM